jgi:L-ribulose-5-phosphate 4-epimerase
MKLNEEYIKFSSEWEKAEIEFDQNILAEINEIRTKLKGKNWLGELPNGIGFGNISVRLPNSNHFLITGSATGGLKLLSKHHISKVEKVNIDKNWLKCFGETIASAESLSHAIFYEHSEHIKAVIHIHNAEVWKQQLHQLPTSSVSAEYGTPEMAISLKEELVQINQTSGIIIMGGHVDGILAFGINLSDAFHLLNKLQ